ncbi:MAG: ABC transporter permease subunit [Fastidiosipila sp.]|nr:ABC transporter permease subunit [Fastidiosipila sp.]
MTKLRKFKNYLRSGSTLLASLIVVFVLLAVIVYIFINGWSSLDLSLFSNNYYATNILAEANKSEEISEAGSFLRPGELNPDIPFSEQYGFAITDEINRANHPVQKLVYIDPESPLRYMFIATAGDSQGQKAPIESGTNLLFVNALDNSGNEISLGQRKGDTAAELVAALDETIAITSYHSQIPGGGIRGAIVATGILIGMSLLISMPVALSAAVYLQRIARDNLFTRVIRSLINLLAGIPSIIFGMMGITIIFPIVKALGVDGLSLLLGSLTMSIMLLPILIRQSEEALASVPAAYTMASLALGATETQTLFKLVLPAAFPGILSAFLLGISRVIAESAALIFTIGTAINEAPSLTSSGSTLAVLVWNLMGGETPNFRLASAVSLVILTMVLLLNISVKIIVSLTRKNKAKKVM